jgi:hypothetical protein
VRLILLGALVGGGLVLGFFFVQPTAAQGPAPPSAETGEASDVGLQNATVHGVVNPNGSETTYHFRYGLDKHYGQSTPVRSAGAGTFEIPVEANLQDLSFGRVYHYRLVADSDQGHVTGRDRTFRTHEPVLQGPYKVNLRVYSGGRALGQHPGTKVSRRYRLDARRCNDARCKKVKLDREGKRGVFHSLLHRSGRASFTGSHRFKGWCDSGLRFHSKSSVHLRATRARGGRAVRMKGSLHVALGGCAAGGERAKLLGRAR